MTGLGRLPFKGERGLLVVADWGGVFARRSLERCKLMLLMKSATEPSCGVYVDAKVARLVDHQPAMLV